MKSTKTNVKYYVHKGLPVSLVNFFCLIAATSLLNWAKKEKNGELKKRICQLYDISLLWATVQREFAEKVCIEPNQQLHVQS